MALYFKCPNCETYFMDLYGENAAEDTKECYMNGPYLCPVCDSPADNIESKEYNSAPKERTWENRDKF